MPQAWSHREPTLYAGTHFDHCGSRFRLTVERTPHDKWDWLVWRVGGPSTLTRYGIAATAKAASDAAERAATELSIESRMHLRALLSAEEVSCLPNQPTLQDPLL